MRKVLIVTDMFPPYNGVGVIRTTKFVKYLPSFGWRPIVLTRRCTIESLDSPDEHLAEQLDRSTPVFRAICPSYEVYRLLSSRRLKQGSLDHSADDSYSRLRALLVPDPYVLWYFTALHVANRIFAKFRIDAVYTTSPRETSHLIGRTLHSRFCVPWVADFRDPWIDKSTRPKRRQTLDRFESRLQKAVLKDATRVVVAWPGIGEGLTRACPSVRSKLEIIFNGYDELDFTNVQPFKFERFTIVYAGNLQRNSNSQPFFAALRKVVEQRPELRKQLQLVLIGKQDPYIIDLLKECQMPPVLRLGQLPHRECMKYLLGGDILLLCVPFDDPRRVPSKVFEYLRAYRPILAVAEPDLDALQIVSSVSQEYLASKCPNKISAFLIDSYTRKTEHLLPRIDRQLRKFERRELTRRLAKVLDTVVIN